MDTGNVVFTVRMVLPHYCAKLDVCMLRAPPLDIYANEAQV
jgi:hypothetical protein